MLSRIRSAFAVLLFVLSGVAAAQTPITGTFTLAGSPVAHGTVSFLLENCGLSPTSGSASYNTTLNASGVITTAVQGNASNGCSLSNGVNVSYFEVTLSTSAGALVWRRNYQIPVQSTPFNLATATSMTTLPPPLSNGATGAPGPTGAPGSSASVAIGTVTTGNPGDPAAVINSGTPTNAILNFTIPKGADGANAAAAAGAPLQIQIKKADGTGLDATNFQTDAATKSDLLGVRNFSATSIAPTNPLASLGLPAWSSVSNDYVARDSGGNPRSDFADQTPFHLTQNINRRWGCCDVAAGLSVNLNLNSGFENVESNFMNYNLLNLNFEGHSAAQGGGAFGYTVRAHGMGDTVGQSHLLLGSGVTRGFDEGLEPDRNLTAFDASIFGGQITLLGADAIGNQKMQVGNFGAFGYDPSAVSEQRLLIDVTNKWQAGTYSAATLLPAAPINILDPNGIVLGALNANDGTVISFSWFVTPFMDLRGATQWTTNFPVRYVDGATPIGEAYYDINHNFISGLFVAGANSSYPPGTVFNVPAGAVYVRLTFQDSDIQSFGLGHNTIMVLAGPTVPGSFQAFDSTSQYGPHMSVPALLAAGSTTGIVTPIDDNFIQMTTDSTSALDTKFGVSTVTHLTSPVDSNIYTGTCPNIVNTGTSNGDAFKADAQGNLLTPATANYCTTVGSTAGMSVGTLVVIADGSFNMEYTRVISVADSTHFTAAMRHPHLAGSIVSFGGAVGYAWSSPQDDRAPGTEDSVENEQHATDILAYPIVANLAGNQLLLYNNWFGGGKELKTHSTVFNTPKIPVVISSPVVIGGVLTSFTANNDVSDYGTQANTPGHAIFLPTPPVSFGGSSACTTNPVISWKRSSLQINSAYSYNPIIKSGGTGCPSDLTVNVSPTVPQPFVIYPITWIYRTEDSTGSATSGFIRTEPVVTSAWNTGDQVNQSMWWNRYMGSQQKMSGDDITANSSHFGPTLVRSFRDTQTGQALEVTINETPAWKYLGFEANNWAPTGIDSKITPPVMRRFEGLYSTGLAFDTPPTVGNRPGVAAGQQGGTLISIGCANNNAGSAATHCNGSVPIFNPFNVFNISLGGASKTLTMGVDPNTGTWTFAPILFAQTMSSKNLVAVAGFPEVPDPSALSIQNSNHYTVLSKNPVVDQWSSDTQVSAGEYLGGLVHAGGNAFTPGLFSSSNLDINPGSSTGSTTYVYNISCVTAEGEGLPVAIGTNFGPPTLDSTHFLIPKGSIYNGGCTSGNVYRTSPTIGGIGWICSFTIGQEACNDTGQAADTTRQPRSTDTTGSFQIGTSQKVKAITGNAPNLFAHSGAAGGEGNIVTYDAAGNAHNSAVNISKLSGMQVATGTGCATGTGPAAGAGLANLEGTCVATLTIPVAEADTSYAIVGCMVSGVEAHVSNPGSLTTTSFTISEYADTNTAVTGGTITCLVIHN